MSSDSVPFDPTKIQSLSWTLQSENPVHNREYYRERALNYSGRSSVSIAWIGVFVNAFSGIVHYCKGNVNYAFNRALLLSLILIPIAVYQSVSVLWFNHGGLDHYIREIIFFTGGISVFTLLDLCAINFPVLWDAMNILFGQNTFAAPQDYVTLLPLKPGAVHAFDQSLTLLRMFTLYLMFSPRLLVAVIVFLGEGIFLFCYTGCSRDTMVGLGFFLNLIISCAFYMHERSQKLWYFNLKQAHCQIATYAKMADKAHNLKSHFFAYLFHELRVPLHSLSLSTDLFLDGMVEDPQGVLRMMRSQVTHATRILNDVLAMRNLEEGKFVINKEYFSIGDLLRRVKSSFADEAFSREIQLELIADEVTNTGFTYVGDDSRLQQVLTHFISNSLKFTPAGGKVTLYGRVISTENVESLIELGVTDSGGGIPDEEKSKIFQPYLQIANVKKTEVGTGMGLNISKKLIELHGGQISFDSQRGQGSRFYFQISFKHLPSAAKPSENSKRMGDSPKSRLRNMPNEPDCKHSVLVVEDSGPSRKILIRILKRLNYTAYGVIDGVECVEFFKNGGTTSAVFMDKQMPNMDGIEATSRIRSLGYKGAIIALTGNPRSEDRDQFMSAGADYFMTKPARVDELKMALAETLGTHDEYS